MTTTRRITVASALILSVAAAGVPTASARPVGADPVNWGADTAPAAVYSQPDKSIAAVSPPSSAGVARAGVPPAPVRIQTPPSEFDWGDAGIGAAGGAALALLGLGGALVLSQRRPHRSRHRTAQPN
jgi:hypothetical protein